MLIEQKPFWYLWRLSLGYVRKHTYWSSWANLKELQKLALVPSVTLTSWTWRWSDGHLDFFQSWTCSHGPELCSHFQTLPPASAALNPSSTLYLKTVWGPLSLRRRNHPKSCFLDFGGEKPSTTWTIPEFTCDLGPQHINQKTSYSV